MAYGAFDFSIDEINYLVAAVVATAAALTAFSGTLSFQNIGFYLLVSTLVLSVREFGQRTIAQWMDAEVKLNLSVEGAGVTVFGAIIAVLTELPFLLLLPVFNTFSIEKYEQWGKSIDSMWSKRMAWITYGGIAALLLGGLASTVFSYGRVADAFFIFSAFQLLPFDHPHLPCGELDGAYILRQNGFFWLILMFISLAGFFLL